MKPTKLAVCLSLWALLAALGEAWSPQARLIVRRQDQSLVSLSSKAQRDDSGQDPLPPNPAHHETDRRQLLSWALASSLGVTCLPSDASALSTVVDESVSLNALSDLPPIPADSVRIFLCRHGQTENNRLKQVQGARVDAPINEMGQRQAERLGQALARAAPPPEFFFHSPLSRAQQTAFVASQQFGASSPPLRTLPALAELDFGGTVEGQPVEEVRAQMVAAYSAWAVGRMDTRMATNGESFAEILVRIQAALNELVLVAARCPTRCVAAVAHSTYLRMLLAVVQDLPLAQFALLEQKNGCVNVIDFQVRTGPAAAPATMATTTVQAKSNLFGGSLSQAPSSFQMDVPAGNVLRTGEKRHLGDLAV